MDLLFQRLERLYGRADGRRIREELDKRFKGIPSPPTPRAGHGLNERDVMLITYADTLREPETAPLQTLHTFLSRHTDGLFTHLHLLPFYPFSSDDGFSVVDFRTIRDDLGTWRDIRHLAETCRLSFDAVINHVSTSSAYMKGYLRDDPAYREFFIRLDPATDTSAVLRTRNLPLLHPYPGADGERHLWTTFSRDQVDLNYHNPAVLLEILDVLLFYRRQGASMLRLDAIPYLWKELGTSCAHLPQTHDVIKLIRDVFDRVDPGLLLLTETNVPHRENVSYTGNGRDEAQVIYNFSLPPLILHAMQRRNGTVLSQWARSLEPLGPGATFLNITATHDGIGMRPTEGLLDEPERRFLCELAERNGGAVTGKRNTDGSVSPYELNLNYFDAINDPSADEPLDRQVDRFMCSQAISLAFAGMPGIYIHSLLGSRNNRREVEETGISRRINREKLALGDVARHLQDPGHLRSRVLTRFRHLLHLRKQQPAFHPDSAQEVPDYGPGFFCLRRTPSDAKRTIVALHNITDRRQPCPGELQSATDILTGGPAPKELCPWQVCWMTGAGR